MKIDPRKIIMGVGAAFILAAAGLVIQQIANGGIDTIKADDEASDQVGTALNEATLAYIPSNPVIKTVDGSLALEFLYDGKHAFEKENPHREEYLKAGLREKKGQDISVENDTQIHRLIKNGGVIFSTKNFKTIFGDYLYTAQVRVRFDGKKWDAHTIKSTVEKN